MERSDDSTALTGMGRRCLSFSGRNPLPLPASSVLVWDSGQVSQARPVQGRSWGFKVSVLALHLVQGRQ